ncbi:hypothetical protein GDO86_006643 [Hymenochirus boettgeri]|uniref:Cytoskeleton-associated protein 2 C-terminal domain-containing protein n=1 Tax=Hymenochirus boettgeri TaxID=247094 RepID=A0A8T2J9F6_9PIPI|nr:hypothetical protein GDO86_006643 [Hymenochirus boettgeri]
MGHAIDYGETNLQQLKQLINTVPRGKDLAQNKFLSHENNATASRRFNVPERSETFNPKLQNRTDVSATSRDPSGSNKNKGAQQKKIDSRQHNDVHQDRIHTLANGLKETAQSHMRKECGGDTSERQKRVDAGSQATIAGAKWEQKSDVVSCKGKVTKNNTVLNALNKTIGPVGDVQTRPIGNQTGLCKNPYTTDRSVKLKPSTTQFHHPKVIHKMLHHTNVTQGKPCTGLMSQGFLARQPVYLNRGNKLQSGLHGSSKTVSSCSTIVQYKSSSLQHKKDKTQKVSTATAINRNKVQVPVGCKGKKEVVSGSLNVMSVGHLALKKESAFSSQPSTYMKKTNGHQSTGSMTCSTLQHQARNINVSTNHRFKVQNKADAAFRCKQRKYTEVKTNEKNIKMQDTEKPHTRSTAIKTPPDMKCCDSRLHTTPKMTAEDRRKKLEEWLSTKGKTYKRPPMVFPKKQTKRKTVGPCSLWSDIEEEEELMCLTKKINDTLNDCLQLIDQGAASNAVLAALSRVPEAEKFAKFWVCKARLLERNGIFDVVLLYEQAVRSGAKPIEELRDVVFEIMKNTSKKQKAVTFGPLPTQSTCNITNSGISLERKILKNVKTQCTELLSAKGSAVKFQAACLSSKKKEGGQGWKILTPVRRSLRITPTPSQHSGFIQDRDTVVASLDELLDMTDTDGFLYTRNEAFTEETHLDILGIIQQSTSKKHEDAPP